MARRITIPFVGGAAVSRSVSVNNQATVNLMQAIKGSGAKANYVLESVPGHVDLGPLGDGPIRTSQMRNSAIRGTKDLYGVYGNKLMAQTANSGNIEIGTLDANPGRVEMARGRNFIFMVDGVSGYTYDGTTFAKVADADFPGNFLPAGTGRPTHCVYIDGFFIVNDANTDNFYISGLEDPTSWNALDFDAASVAPDNALSIAATKSLLWIIGDETAQAYYNSENADFPYAIVLSATQDDGILAPYSLAESDDGIFYLATTPEGGRYVYQINGQAGRTVTEDEQENFLETVIDPTDAYGFIYKQSGKSFYCLQLSATSGDDPRTSSTLIYNIKAQKWETRELQDGSAWRAGGHGILNNRNIIGSRIQARHLELDLNNFTDAGQEMRRVRRTQIYHNNNNLMDWWAVYIDIQPGVGVLAGQGSNPLLLLRYSDDAGQTFSSYLQGNMGALGKTMQRVGFHGLGQGRNRVYEILVADPVQLTIIGAYAEVEVLND